MAENGDPLGGRKNHVLLRLEICFLLCIHLLELFSVNRLLRLELGRREVIGLRRTRFCVLATIPRLRERGVRDLARRFEISFFVWNSCVSWNGSGLEMAGAGPVRTKLMRAGSNQFPFSSRWA
jgi:hypothetical protein